MRDHTYRLLTFIALFLAAPVQAAPVDGALYAVIENAVDGTSGPVTSYVRFFDGMAATSTFSVLIIGAQTGTTYGQATSLQIPSGASIQYSLPQLLTLAGSTGGRANGDTSYTVYVQDPDAATGYQHVVYDGSSQFFENASVCGNGTLTAATLAGSHSIVVTNAHTSSLSGFPSQVALHNYSTAAVTATVQLVDAGALGSDGSTISATAGAVIGQTTVQVPANTTVSKRVTDLQSAVNWTPSASQAHVNIVITGSSGSNPPLAVEHTVTESGSVDPINLTTACAVNDPTSAATFEGSIAGTSQQSATMAVNLQALTATQSSGQSMVSAMSARVAPEKAQAIARAQSASPTGATLLLSDGSTVTLGGSYTATGGAVTLSGGGYTFTGTVSNGVLSGSYTGPNGTSGSFSTLSADQGTVTAYCGTYNSTRQPAGQPQTTGSGVFNLQIAANGVASGETTPVSGDTDPGTFTGQANGSVVNVVHHSADGDPVNDTDVTATIQNGTVSGTFTTNGGTGSFSGSTCTLPST
jgi:hypothetical protein